MPNPPKPLDSALYESVKQEAKRKFRRWPSAYGSAWLSKEYRKRGGRYANRAGTESSTRKRSKRYSKARSGVHRWMKEKWVQVGPATRAEESSRQLVPCGDGKRDGKACRPLHRLSPHTPPTLEEVVQKHGRVKVRSLARRKSKDMKGRVDWVAGKFRPSSGPK